MISLIQIGLGLYRQKQYYDGQKRVIRKEPQYVEKWLSYHIEHDNKLTDEEYLNTYHGNKARIIREGVLPFSLYAGTLGVSFPCYVLYQQTKNEDARNVCLSVADAILHYSARDRFGYMAHDDFDYFKWCIPDVGYFSVRGNG